MIIRPWFYDMVVIPVNFIQSSRSERRPNIVMVPDSRCILTDRKHIIGCSLCKSHSSFSADHRIREFPAAPFFTLPEMVMRGVFFHLEFIGKRRFGGCNIGVSVGIIDVRIIWAAPDTVS